MKEIKAYIRLKKAEEVVHALEDAGVPGCTVIQVKATGKAAVPEREKFSVEYGEKVSPVVKLEAVCNDEDTERILEVIRKTAFTGHRGDGMIFVSTIDDAVRIRNGERGEKALTS